jgi:hypothetical protein
MERRAVTSAVTALALGAATLGGTAPPASAATGWHSVPGHELTYNGSFDHFAFASKNSAWAVGVGGSFFAPQTRMAWFNGSSWVVYRPDRAFIPTDLASGSPQKAWVVGYNMRGPIALYWTGGSTWRKAPYPSVGLPDQVAAGADGTAYSVAGVGAAGGGSSAVLRFEKGAWVDAKVPLPPSSSITGVDVKSGSDVWLSGTVASDTSVTGLVMHYDGESWKRIDVPGALGVPGNQASLYRIVENSPTNVWVLRVRQDVRTTTNALLHYDGKSWTTADIPGNVTGVVLSSDGKGGAIVVPINKGNATRYLDYNGGKWTATTGPTRTGAAQVSDVAVRPHMQPTTLMSVGTVTRRDVNIPFSEAYTY